MGDVRGAAGRLRDRRLTRPEKTFAGFADILGLVFLMIGLLWTVQAFTERPLNDVWRLGLISGSLMV